MASLNDTLCALCTALGNNFFKERVSDVISNNINKSFDIRPYQKEAFGRFDFYLKQYQDRPQGVPIQLLFHMATGSGKTLIMAGLIIYLYNEGYRDFMFFVNNTNIVRKTKDNFLNSYSSKYLFSNTVSIGGKQIHIHEVNNFQESNPSDINICFNTVQGLHIDLNTPKENSLTFDDFENRKIVLLSDEAHHINAETKKGKLTQDEKDNIISWESTITRIFNANSGNIMLEFTATADLNNPAIAEKYDKKLIFDYPLREFRADGYSKDVKTLQADLSLFDRSLQALLLSQYRKKIFEKNGLLFKPVVLFKSARIEDSKTFQKEFNAQLELLNGAILENIKTASPNGSAVANFFNYCEHNTISLDNLAEELKNDFDINKQLSVNSKEEREDLQIAINTLEDEDNFYRLIFAVDKLNEGWDVLNLFDIVRLYDTRDAKNGVPGKTTMQEAQLIGRGARYCPFVLSGDQNKYLRKFDDDICNEMRICEELYYHASYNPRYIQELDTALIQIGMKAPKYIQRELTFKESFMKSDLYKTGLIFTNRQIKYNGDDVFAINDSILTATYNYSLKTKAIHEELSFERKVISSADSGDIKEKEFKLSEFGEIIIRKAINRIAFFQFDILSSIYPNVKSISEFINSDKYLKNIRVKVKGLSEDVDNMTSSQKLSVCLYVLEEVAKTMRIEKIEYKGSKEFKPSSIKNQFTNLQQQFAIEENPSDKEIGRSMCNSLETNYYLDLSSKEWYAQTDCYGSSEEKALIIYINSVYDKLSSLYDKVYLIRNEKQLKLYDFEKGRVFEPDYVLFLLNTDNGIRCQYQIFIEPKGAHLIKNDMWKQEFLSQIKDVGTIEQVWHGKEYNIWGLPFFNKTVAEIETKFKNAFDSSVLVEQSAHKSSIKIETSIEKSLLFIKYLPFYSLRAACGKFGSMEKIDEEERWVDASSIGKLNKDMFVVKAAGNSMEEKIHDGNLCVFRHYDSGHSYQGNIVLVQMNQKDSDYDGTYTIKVFQKGEKKQHKDADITYAESVTLLPINTEYEPISVSGNATDFAIIGEFVGIIN